MLEICGVDIAVLMFYNVFDVLSELCREEVYIVE